MSTTPSACAWCSESGAVRRGLARGLLACVLAAGLAGCASGGKPQDAREYPAALRQKAVLDIQVLRRGTRIELANTSSRAFGPSTLWLNRYFAKDIEGFAVGQTLDLDLEQFRDEHGDAFRAGGFFAAEPPKRIVMAQIQTRPPSGEAELFGLVVVRGEGD